MANSIKEIQQLGQSVWYDSLSRGLIKSGELKKLIDLGISGLTSNPTIFEKAIVGSTDYDAELMDLVRSGKSSDKIYEALVMEDIRDVADLLRPIYERTGGADGFASLEVNPNLAHDEENTVEEARRIFIALDRPNVMMKVPATPAGVPAVRRLIGEGINVNVTLTFSLSAYRNVRQAYITGLEDHERFGGDVSVIASVASFFVSRVDTAVDSQLEERALNTGSDISSLVGKAAIANAKLAYRDFKNDFSGSRFASLRSKGAKVQRPLWASTSTKNPAYSDVMYVESLIGRDTVDTVPEPTLTAILDHARAANTLGQGIQEAEELFSSLSRIDINMDDVTSRLLTDGVKLFVDSFNGLMANIESKRKLFLNRD